MAIVDNRKSKEELDQDIKEAVDITPEDTPKETPQEETEKEPVEETTPEEEVEEPKETPKKQEPKEEEDVDYREKFTASTREAQVLSAKNKKLTEIIDKASDLAEITEDDLVREYPNWEELGEFERRLAKDNLLNRKRFELVQDTVQQTKNIDEWVDKVDKFVEESSVSGKYPDLEGQEDSFRRFALKPTRRGGDFDDLVMAYLYNVKPLTKHKGSLLETGTGGPKEIKPKELTVEEIKTLRTKDPKKYKQMILSGKINIDL